MLSFEPTEEQRLMRDSVGDFARATLGAHAREHEAMRGVPDAVRRAAFELGLGTMDLPEDAGGQGLGLVTTVLLEEELGRADAAAAFALAGPGAFGTAVAELARPLERAALLAPFASAEAGHARFGAVGWSELRPNAERAGMSTVAVRDGAGYRLSGHKAFVHNAGLAERVLVVAQVEPERGWDGLGAFVVPTDAPGVTIGARHATVGLDCAWFGELGLDAVSVPAAARLEPEGSFTAALVRFFAKRALVVAARAVGLAGRAYDMARSYCDERVAFGKPIGHFQAVAFELADRHMDVESARWLLWRAAWHWDGAQPERAALGASAAATAHALEVAMRTADACVGLHGGIGFVRDLLAEKLMRDAKQMALACPTALLCDQLAAAVEVGAPLDPAAVLPTPEAQAIFVC
ncbi:MAG: acyl-CoA dehydrogenase family protein [Polyangiaceae bacterium]|nr:acyl-CoA dehydrogenase family protein [Polyangiaceae bacterium]